MPISPEVIIEQKNASGKYKYLTGIDHFRSFVKICLSFIEFHCLSSAADAAQSLMEQKYIVIQQIFGCFLVNGGLHVSI